MFKFMWIKPFFYELSCSQTHTQDRKDRHTDGHKDEDEYFIVVLEKSNYTKAIRTKLQYMAIYEKSSEEFNIVQTISKSQCDFKYFSI